MIYDAPPPNAPVDQGDLLDDCPINLVHSFGPESTSQPLVDFAFPRVVVLTQTCDLANQKNTFANVAEVFDVQFLIDRQVFKPADVKGPLRADVSGAGISCRPTPLLDWAK